MSVVMTVESAVADTASSDAMRDAAVVDELEVYARFVSTASGAASNGCCVVRGRE